MCQGLPCVGTRVRLLRDFTGPNSPDILRGTEGGVRRADIDQREMDVDFFSKRSFHYSEGIRGYCKTC